MINKDKLLSFLLFLLIPILSVLFSLSKLKREKGNNFYYLLISLFFGFLFLKNPPLMDSLRYLELYDQVTKDYLLSISNYVNYYYVAFIFKELGFGYYFIPVFYVSIAVFCIFKSTDLIWKNYNWSLKRYLFLSLGLLILSNPMVISMGLRNATAYFIFILAICYFLLGSRVKSYFIFLLSFLCHFSMFLPIALFFSSLFFKINKFLSIFLVLFGFLFSNVFFEILIQKIPIAALKEHYSSYGGGAESESASGNGIIVYVIFILIKIVLITICYFVENKDFFSKKILNYIFLMTILVAFVSVNQTALYRFLNLTSFFCFIYLCIYIYSSKKSLIFKFLLSMILTIQLIVFDFYTIRYNFYHGRMIEMAYISPLNIFLYDNYEYRKYLSNIDSDGFWKN